MIQPNDYQDGRLRCIRHIWLHFKSFLHLFLCVPSCNEVHAPTRPLNVNRKQIHANILHASYHTFLCFSHFSLYPIFVLKIWWWVHYHCSYFNFFYFVGFTNFAGSYGHKAGCGIAALYALYLSVLLFSVTAFLCTITAYVTWCKCGPITVDVSLLSVNLFFSSFLSASLWMFWQRN